tara:strand:- start:5441 stop:5740 length:300 start_codon:yes stop_codon:yes gene_type:complete
MKTFLILAIALTTSAFAGEPSQFMKKAKLVNGEIILVDQVHTLSIDNTSPNKLRFIETKDGRLIETDQIEVLDQVQSEESSVLLEENDFLVAAGDGSGG